MPDDFRMKPSRMAPEKKKKKKCWREEGPFFHQQGGDRRRHCPCSQAHPRSRIQEACPQAPKETQQFAMKERGPPDVCTETKPNKAVWARE